MCFIFCQFANSVKWDFIQFYSQKLQIRVYSYPLGTLWVTSMLRLSFIGKPVVAFLLGFSDKLIKLVSLALTANSWCV